MKTSINKFNQNASLSNDFLATYFLGANDLAEEAFQLFKESLSEEVPILENLFQKKNGIEYAKLLHKWSPNFKIFGLDTIYDHLKRMEKELKINPSYIVSKIEHNKVVEMIKTGVIEVEFILNQSNEN
ncbi:MAG: hypothetical protein N4A45_12345 [Flavobacteriales bacterium]|nr:hypothetical protein [Flavobacteriales bacterium]